MRISKLLDSWIKEVQALCQPDKVHLCLGTEEEYNVFCSTLVKEGTFVPLKRPNSFWCHTSPEDVARTEASTFICSKLQEDAGPTNNWKDPDLMHTELKNLFQGCMRGRTMYVIAYCMGPIDSPKARLGIEITDSLYAVCNMWLMTRMGKAVWDKFEKASFVKGIHSVGTPLSPGQADTFWPCNPEKRCIAHFPEEQAIWAFGSGYGGNALLGKKCFALRIGSTLARNEGWLAEHMLILGITNPEGKKLYFAAAFPSACGKTNLAMLTSALPGWKIECVGDDIAWMWIDGTLRAINPERGFFGVAPGTSYTSNPSAMRSIEKGTIFTNVALTQDKDVWWEGMTPTPPDHLTNWQGRPWTPGMTAAHPNARFTVQASQCPVIDPLWESPEGVPISAIIFGGRRAHLTPLVYQSFSWEHGVFIGATLSSETTAASTGATGQLRRDPFAMLPFCGYNMGDYFQHWLDMGARMDPSPPIFHVNWFRKSTSGGWLWPGFGDNVRVLKWIFERVSGQNNATSSPIGYLPKQDSLDTSGLSVPLTELFAIDKAAWLEEARSIHTHFAQFGAHLPKALHAEALALEQRLHKQ